MNADLIKIEAANSITVAKCEDLKEWEIQFKQLWTPINREEPIWEKTKKHKPPIPAIFRLYAPHQANLLVYFKLNKVNKGDHFKLEAIGPNSFQLFSGEFQVNSTPKNNEIKIPANAKFKPPQNHVVFLDNIRIKWLLIRRNGKDKKTFYTKLSLYWIFDASFELFRYGHPISLIEELLSKINGNWVKKLNQNYSFSKFYYLIKETLTGKKSPIPPRGQLPGSLSSPNLIEKIIRYCFNNNPPRYKTQGDSILPSLLVQLSGSNNTFNIHHYFLARRLEGIKCDCNDLAALLHLFLKVGGIRNTKTCYSPKFGPLSKKNELFGCGQIAANRCRINGFSRHTFCCLNSDCTQGNPLAGIDCGKIADCTIGPYLGKTSLFAYLEDAIDHGTNRDNFHKKIQALMPNIECDERIAHINWIAAIDCKDIDRQEHIETFIKRSGFDYKSYEAKQNRVTTPKFVVGNWRQLPECYWTKPPWETSHFIITGEGETLKTWMMEKSKGPLGGKDRLIQINLYVASIEESGHDHAMHRFLSLANKYTADGSHKNPKQVKGDNLKLNITKGNQSRQTWLYNNLVFDIFFYNVPENTRNSVIEDIKKIDTGSLKDSLKTFIPKLKYLSDTSICVEIGQRFEIALEIEDMQSIYWDYLPPKNIIQFSYYKQGNGNLTLYFDAIHQARGQLLLAVVNRRNLLVTNVEIDIHVIGERESNILNRHNDKIKLSVTI